MAAPSSSGGVDMAFLADIKGFDGKGTLKRVGTTVTTASGRRFKEMRTDSGDVVIQPQAELGLGFCPDLQPDREVGVVMERLIVGSVDVAHDFFLLKQLSVTHILNTAAGVPNAFPNDFTYHTEEMYDDDNEQIMDHYQQCEDFIDCGRGKGVVLVHCLSGRSRSVSMAIAYVMHKEGISYEEALAKVRETRPQAGPNPSFIRQLRELESELHINPVSN